MNLTVRFSLFSLMFTVFLGIILFYFYPKKTDRILSDIETIIRLQPKDELIVTELTTTEQFSKESYSYLFDKFPLGDIKTTINLIAHYKYFVKLSELSYELQGDTLVLKAPQIYPSLPIAFDINTLTEQCQSSLLGPDCQQSIQQLKNEISQQMPLKAKSHRSFIYDKAAKSLADNFYSFIRNNTYPFSFSKIMVVIGSENSESSRIFSYNFQVTG